MLWSSACEYAIRATTHLAATPQALVQLKDIAAAEDIPAPFAAKILQSLVRSGVLRSVKGPHGGYGLARPPSKITFLDVKAATEGTSDLDSCAAGLGQCSDGMLCPLHETFKPIRRAIRHYLETTTIADFSDAVARKRAIGTRTSRARRRARAPSR
jgi:Rrf2 family protein